MLRRLNYAIEQMTFTIYFFSRCTIIPNNLIAGIPTKLSRRLSAKMAVTLSDDHSFENFFNCESLSDRVLCIVEVEEVCLLVNYSELFFL